jgi:protein-L-isoaspartate(D-aspartate) O-methyltransferase
LKPLQAHRDFYARLVVGGADSQDARLINAFAKVPREDFLGPGPWPIYAGAGYIPTVSDDAALLYQDVLVGLAPERGINNGQPSLHARCLAACAVAPGDTVLHIGAGTGYYSAILAELTGASGQVIAYEIKADLARRARANLAHLPQVEVLAASGSAGPLPLADVIYVNAGATHPLALWLDALKPGGRLVFPLTPNEGFGCMPLITRLGARSDLYAARLLARVSFIACMGARDEATARALGQAVATQPIHTVQALHRGSPPDASAWCVGNGWWLSTAAPP